MSTPSPQAPRGCPKCGGLRYLVERAAERAVARVCDCAGRCDICQGRGFVMTQREETFSAKVGPKQYEVLAPCACRVLPKRVQGFNHVGIPAVLAHARFENYRAAREPQERGLQLARQFAHHFNPQDPAARGFVLGGPVGTGKTHLLAATLRHLCLERGVQTQYVEISLLYATIRRGFAEQKSGGEIIGPLSEVPVLAIDELGKGRMSPFELETMDELIARRYNAGRTTLFATNYSLDPERKQGRKGPPGYHSTDDAKVAAKDSEFLRDRVGERIYSRLMEMCDFVEFSRDTPDYRRTRQEMRPS